MGLESEYIDLNPKFVVFDQPILEGSPEGREGSLEGRNVAPLNGKGCELELFADHSPKLQEVEGELDKRDWVVVKGTQNLPELDSETVERLRNCSKEVIVGFQSLTEDYGLKLLLGEALAARMFAGDNTKLDALFAQLLGENSALAAHARLYLHAHKDEIDSVRTVYAQFDSDMAAADATAASMHDELLEAARGQELPHTDPHSGITTASEALLKFAFERARVVFCPLLQIAYTPEQEIQVARLVQIILCGKEALADSALPATPFCFCATELAGKQSQPIAVPVESDTSPLDHFLRHSKTSRDAAFTDCLDEVVTLFFKDVVNRGGNRFHCGETQLLCESPDMQKESFIIRTVVRLFSEHLSANPDLIEDLIQRHQALPCLTKAQAAYGNSEQPFSAETLKAILLQTQPQDVVEDFVAAAQFSPAVLDALVLRSGCRREDIANLMPAKVLEIMTLMNQAFLFHSFEPLALALMEQKHSLMPAAPERVFDYSTSALSQLTNQNTYLVQLQNFGYEEEGLKPQMLECQPMARVRTTLDIPHVHAVEEHNVAITTMADAHFSWRATPSVIDAVHNIVSGPQADAGSASLPQPSVSEAGWMWKTAASIASLAWYLNPFAYIRFR